MIGKRNICCRDAGIVRGRVCFALRLLAGMAALEVHAMWLWAAGQLARSRDTGISRILPAYQPVPSQ